MPQNNNTNIFIRNSLHRKTYMKTPKKIDLDTPENFINRELSWLSFNFRVLAEAENSDVPLLDRLKFIAIVSSNLDEFTVVRIANTIRAYREGVTKTDVAGMSAQQVLEEMTNQKKSMITRQYHCLQNVILPQLKEEGIELIRTPELTDTDKEFLEGYFQNNISAALTPMAIDPAHPFPLLASGAVYTIFKVKPIEQVAAQFVNSTDTILVQVPGSMNRFIKLPNSDKTTRIATLDDTVQLFAHRLLGGYDIINTSSFRVLRDAEMNVDDESTDDLLGAMDQAVKSRRWGRPIALEISYGMEETVKDYLCRKLEIDEEENMIMRMPYLLRLKDFFGFLGTVNRPDLLEEPWPPQEIKGLDSDNIFADIRKSDHFISLPYHSFNPVVKLVSQAADDKKVLAIKITLYRVSGDSPLVKSLIRAAQNGKQVTVLVELKARFDEEANIHWAKALDSAGAHVVYGVVGYKTHSKVLMVVRREELGIKRYVHLATGNYNDKTAKLYTDCGIMTCNTSIGEDVSGFFNVITGYSIPPRWNLITIAPTDMRDRILNMIKREIDKHTPETPGHIRAKMNSCIDPKVIKALYEASIAGVKVELIIRGLCRLKAGIPKLSENIKVRSILDRFLEHPRIFQFSNGGENEIYMASADWMERNFDQRLEILFPVLEPKCKKQAIEILDAGFNDNVKAWELQPDNTYIRVTKPKQTSKQLRNQEYLYRKAYKRAPNIKKEHREVFEVRATPVE